MHGNSESDEGELVAARCVYSYFGKKEMAIVTNTMEIEYTAKCYVDDDIVVDWLVVGLY